MKSEFFNHNSKPSYALMSTISGHVTSEPMPAGFGLSPAAERSERPSPHS